MADFLNNRNVIIGVAATTGAGIIAYALARKDKNELAMPPRPPGSLPIFGHLLKLNPKCVHGTLLEWSKIYGPIMTVDMGPSPWVIINSPKIARDLLEIRGANYSDRMNNDVSTALSYNAEMYGFSPHGDYLRIWRKITNNSISKSKLASNHEQKFDYESRLLMKSFLATSHHPEGVDSFDLLFLYTINVITSVLFSRRFENLHEPRAAEMITVINEFNQIASNAVIDLFPYLKVAQWNNIRRAKKLQERAQKVWGVLIEEGRGTNCVVDEYLNFIDKEEHITYMGVVQTAIGFTLAGTDTTGTGLINMINILACHPNVQDRAFEELKDVVGLDRLPESKDETQLPYIQAIVREVLRFRPPVSLGLTHVAKEDDVYEGLRIPAGTPVVANQFALNMDPQIYDEPEIFNPDRFMTEIQDTNIRSHYSFGFGRRICPGMMFAEKSIFLVAARLLWSFKLMSPLDETGKEIPVPLMGIESALFLRAPRGNVRFVARHSRVEELLEME